MGVRSTRPRAPGWGDCWELERSRTRWVKAPPGGERSMVGAQCVRERFRTDRSWVPTGGRAVHDRHATRERTIAQRIRRSSSRTRWLSLACSSLVCLARALVVRREESPFRSECHQLPIRSRLRRRSLFLWLQILLQTSPSSFLQITRWWSRLLFSATATLHRLAVSTKSRCLRARPSAPSAAVFL